MWGVCVGAHVTMCTCGSQDNSGELGFSALLRWGSCLLHCVLWASWPVSSWEILLFLPLLSYSKHMIPIDASYHIHLLKKPPSCIKLRPSDFCPNALIHWTFSQSPCVLLRETIQNALQGISALLQLEWLRVAVIVWGFLLWGPGGVGCYGEQRKWSCFDWQARGMWVFL